MFVYWLLVTGHCMRVLYCKTIFMRNFLGCMMITSSSMSKELFFGVSLVKSRIINISACLNN